MILAQLSAYSRHTHQATKGDRFGAQVFRQEIVEAALRYADNDGVHLFSEMDDDGLAIAAMQARYRTPTVRAFPLTALPDAIDAHDYVFVVHGPEFQVLGELRLQAARRFPIDAVIHSINLPCMLSLWFDAVLLADACDAIVVSSEAGLKTVRRLWSDACSIVFERTGGRRRDEPMFVQIPLGVDETVLRPRPRSECRRLLEIPEDARVLVWVGRLTPKEKADLEIVIDAARNLRRDGVPVHLLLAGQDPTGEYSAELRRAAHARGLQDALTIVPNFQHFLKPAIYGAADVFVSPSDNIQETFGISLIEAMSCGIPVVASDWSGYRDLVVHDETGILVPTVWCAETAARVTRGAPCTPISTTRYDLAQHTAIDRKAWVASLRSLLDDPGRRERLGARARERVEARFAWPVVMRQYKELWREQQRRVAHGGRIGINSVYDYNQLFSHFATTVARDDTRFRRNGHPISGHSSSSSHAIAQVGDFLTNEQRIPFTLSDVRASQGASGVEAVMYLLKHGVVEMVDQ